jgi:hypothetical protein
MLEEIAENYEQPVELIHEALAFFNAHREKFSPA